MNNPPWLSARLMAFTNMGFGIFTVSFAVPLIM